ncbi:MAG: hypothetical protein ACI4PR_04720 [Acutalibacteraceae bacterium]
MKKFKILSLVSLSVLLGCIGMAEQLPLYARIDESLGWAHNYYRRHRRPTAVNSDTSDGESESNTDIEVEDDVNSESMEDDTESDGETDMEADDDVDSQSVGEDVISLDTDTVLRARPLWVRMIIVYAKRSSSAQDKITATDDFFRYFNDLDLETKIWICAEMALGVLKVEKPQQWSEYTPEERGKFVLCLFYNSRGVEIINRNNKHIKICFRMSKICHHISDKLVDTRCLRIKDDGNCISFTL